MTKKKVSLMDFEGNPNIGIYLIANDKFCLLGHQVPQEKKNEISKALGVPVYEITVLGTGLLGIFLAGNNDIILCPQIPEYELEELSRIAEKHNMRIITVEDKLNTLGNNFCIAQDKIITTKDYDKDVLEKIKKQTGYKILTITSSKFKAIGSTFININERFFISQEYEEKEVKMVIDEIAGVGTINKGSHYISSGIVGNRNGVIIGSFSTSVEIQNVVESLDYL